VPARLADALLQPFLDPASRTYWAGLMASVLVIALWHARHGGLRWGWFRARSTLLDVQLLTARQLLRALGALPVLGGGLWLATHLVRWLDATLGPAAVDAPAAAVTLAYTAALFVAWDLSRYVVHRLMHAIPALWELHQVHHSATVLTPLTFHRTHPLESVLYGLRGAVVTGGVAGVFFWLFRDAAVQWSIMGVHAVGWLCNVTHGNLRHSHAWIRFPVPVERWLLSPAQHQLHHALDGVDTNYGTWIALWDRLGGSWEAAGATAPARFGLRAPNHDHTLLSAWFAPLVHAGRVALGLAVLCVAVTAEAQEPDVADDERADLEVIVRAEGGKPYVAGSAHVIDEEALEQYEHDDIHAVLSWVPGVVVRGEDGFGLRPNIGIRGANADRSAKITLLEDGVLLAPAPYSAPAAYYFPMVTRMVGVEVFKGPAAIQHGPHTVGGAINLRSRRPPAAPAAAIDLGIGLRNTRKLHAWAGSGGPKWGLLIEGVALSTAGFKQIDGGGPSGFDRGEVVLRARAGGPDASVELKVGTSHERSNETYLGLHIDDYAATPTRRYAATQAARMEWDRTLLEVAVPLRVGQVEVRTVAYHHGMQRVWTKFNRFAGGPDVHDLLQQPEGGQSAVFLAVLRGEEDTVTPEQTLQIGTNDRRFVSAGVQSVARHTQRWKNAGSTLEWGLRLHGDRIDRLHTEDPHQIRAGHLVRDDTPTQVIVDSRASATALAAHVHEDLDLHGVHLIPGLRGEAISTQREDTDAGTVFRTIALPGLGLLWEAGPGLDLFTGVHRGFSPVPPGENRQTAPETSWNAEAGLRLGRGTPQVDAAAYVNDYRNITGQCTFSGGCLGDDIDRQFNGGRALVFGVEGTAHHELLLVGRLSIPIELAYTWTRSFFATAFVSGFPQFGEVQAGDLLPYVPQHQGAARISLAHERWRLGASASARSGLLDAAGPLPVPADVGVPPLVTLDLAADAALTGTVRAYATATNVTGSTALVSWRPLGARPTAPTQVTVGLKVTPSAR